MDNIIPPISVIVPSIGRDTLERTLDSIFDCRYPNIEVIVSFNNCSVYRMIEIQDKYPRIKTLCYCQKFYPFESKNKGIEISTGKYITFLDDDDTSLPAKFFDLSQYLEDNKNVFAVFGQYNVRDYYSGKIKNENCGGHKNPCFDTLIENNYIGSGSIMFRNTEDIKFDKTLYGFGEDWLLSLKIICKYKISHIEIPVYCWTSGNGFTKTFKEKNIDWTEIIKKNKQTAIKFKENYDK